METSGTVILKNVHTQQSRKLLSHINEGLFAIFIYLDFYQVWVSHTHCLCWVLSVHEGLSESERWGGQSCVWRVGGNMGLLHYSKHSQCIELLFWVTSQIIYMSSILSDPASESFPYETVLIVFLLVISHAGSSLSVSTPLWSRLKYLCNGLP